MMRRLRALSVFLAWVWALSPAWAQEQGQDREPVRVKAKTLTYDRESDTVTASGDVVVTRGDTTVTAETISVNRTTNAVEARGDVVVNDPQGRIEAEALWLEMDDETGTITNGTVYLPRNQYILTGRTLQKSYGQTYHIEKGAFTTCNCEDFQKADWSIGAGTVDVNLRGKGEFSDGVFRVRGVPVFYLPYGVVPIRSERQSGFLFPRYGFSNKRGFQWQQPFYWAISKSHDLTITADLETAARLGVLGEYRYAPNEYTEGEFLASYLNEQIRGPATITTPINRWSVTGVHRQSLADDVRFYSDLFFVSDDLFLREINLPFYPGGLDADSRELRARRFTDSHGGVVKTWERALLRAEASYYQDLINDQDFAFQVLPRVQWRGHKHVWQNRLEAGIAMEGVHFYRNQGYAGQRFDIAPSLSFPFHLGRYAFGSLTAVGHETVYHMTSEDVGQPPLPESGRLRGNQTREIGQLQAQVGTRFSRAFDVGWGRLLKLQHVVEPEVSYVYIPFVDQDHLPLYDALDRVNKRNLFVYGVSNRLLGKFATRPPDGGTPEEAQTEIRELARLTINQAYDPTRQLSKGDRHFSDLDIYARVTPVPYITFAADTTYDVDRGDLVAARLGLFLRDPRPLPPTTPLLQHLQRSTTVGISYVTITDRILKEFDASIIFRLNEQISTAYVGRYDLNAGSFIGNRYFLRYVSAQKCWYVDLGLIEKVNPNEFEFRFLFTLVGLSSSGRTAF
jgi:LPS-assembly protein